MTTLNLSIFVMQVRSASKFSHRFLMLSWILKKYLPHSNLELLLLYIKGWGKTRYYVIAIAASQYAQTSPNYILEIIILEQMQPLLEERGISLPQQTAYNMGVGCEDVIFTIYHGNFKALQEEWWPTLSVHKILKKHLILVNTVSFSTISSKLELTANVGTCYAVGTLLRPLLWR